MKILFLLLSINLVHASDDWLRLTCFGSTTPALRAKNITPKMSDLAFYYFEVKEGQNIPSVVELRNANEERFYQISMHCWNVRMQKMDLSNFAPDKIWLDWYTDFQYTGFKIALASYENVCRQKGEACRQTSDCCDTKTQACHPMTKSCEAFSASNTKPEGNSTDP